MINDATEKAYVGRLKEKVEELESELKKERDMLKESNEFIRQERIELLDRIINLQQMYMQDQIHYITTLRKRTSV